MEYTSHQKMTREIIEAVYPDIDHDVRACLERSSMLVHFREVICRRRELHFDRIPYAGHESAWDIGMLEMRYRLMRYRWHYARKKYRKACREVGILIHMIEDFFCHSNTFDLPEKARDEVVRSLVRLDGYPKLEDVSLMFSSYALFQRLLHRDDGYSHSRTLGSYPTEREMDLIASTMKEFFNHYGIIV